MSGKLRASETRSETRSALKAGTRVEWDDEHASGRMGVIARKAVMRKAIHDCPACEHFEDTAEQKHWIVKADEMRRVVKELVGGGEMTYEFREECVHESKLRRG